jgi:hypothetical protein
MFMGVSRGPYTRTPPKDIYQSRTRWIRSCSSSVRWKITR